MAASNFVTQACGGDGAVRLARQAVQRLADELSSHLYRRAVSSSPGLGVVTVSGQLGNVADTWRDEWV